MKDKKEDEGEPGATNGAGDATGATGKEIPVMFESLMNVLALNKDVLKTCGTKTLLKLLASSVLYTQNRYKRAEVRTFLKCLRNPKYTAVQQAFYSILLESISHRELYVSTSSSSKTSLELLKWITIVANGSQSLNSEFANLLALLSSRVQGKRFERSAEKKVFGLFASLEPAVLTSLVESLVNINGGIVAVSFCIKFLDQSSKLEGYLGTNGFPSKAQLLDLFGKECLMTKVSKSSWVLQKTAQYMVARIVDVKAFEDSLLPVVKKAMLRSPEIAIEGVGFCLQAMKFDLSPFTGQFSKMLGPNLHSQEENTRNHAVFASLALSLHINNVEAFKELIGWYFDLFNGKEGKLTVAAHKINILHSIDKIKTGCVLNLDQQSLTNVSKFVIVKCVKILETEVHEGTLVEVIDLISSWGGFLDSDFPPELSNYLKKVLPNSKGALRTSLGRLFSSIFGTETRAKPAKATFKDILIQSFERSYAQVTQIHGLSECFAFASAILQGEARIPDVLKSTIWEMYSHVSDKFVHSCNPWTLDHIALVSSQILSMRLDAIPNQLWNALAYVVTTNSYEVRLRCLKVFSVSVLKVHYQSIIASIKVVFASGTISNHIKEEILKGLSRTASDLDQIDKEILTMDLLWPTHMCTTPDLWVELSQNLKVDPGKLLSQREMEVYEQFVNCFDGTDLMKSIIKTVAFVMGASLVNYAVSRVKQNVNDPEILNVTRDEYFVFRTPEGQLFDTSVIDTADDSTKNMKRESRVYSYKEQLEEIQLRKELEEKRKASGKPTVYSAKQKEAIKLQLTKEAVMREKVSKLHKSVSLALGLLEACFEGNPTVFGLFIKDFIQQLIEIMRSPVSADGAVELFIRLGKSYFYPEFRGVTVAQRSLKIISPACDLPKEWQEESLLSGLYPTCDYLLTASKNAIDGASFSYCLPMLRVVVQKYPKDSHLLTCVLNIILNVVKDPTNTLKNKTSFIPRSQIIQLLYGVIGTNDGLIQQVSVAAILEATKLVTSESTVTLLEPKEIELHLEALTSHLKICRETGLKSLNLVASIWKSDDKIIANAFAANVYRERFDSASELCTIAQNIWDSAKIAMNENLYGEIFRAVTHPCEEVRSSASKALAAFLKSNPSKVDSTVQDLISSYNEYNIPTPPLIDNLGRVIQEGVDKWEGRCGVGLAIREIAPEISPQTARTCFEWLVTTTLSDRSQSVHNIVLEAAVEIVQVHGTECLNDFISTIETNLDKVGSSGQYDNVRQACVVLMGSLARHLSPTDSRVKSIFGTLIDTLSTPSEKVQESVAHCLPALVPAISSESANILKRLLDKLMEAENFGERRGAAYGIAGMIKGLGILSLKQHDIMNILATGMQNKKNYRNREGALMALELLCEFLGRLFEPYIVHVLPYLLQCLGDSNVYVREATENTAKRVMSRLSGHGVKLVLPALIGALNEDSWRTKCGSVDLLGRMAYCAPKQLSGCLPMIVPRLIEVLGDSHVKVQEAGAKALGLIGSVIQNPEIQFVVPVLLQALQDPGKKSSSCLQSLLATQFVHFVDPPSLALIMPVVQRAFQDRSIENRKMACQVIGNMYSLTDHSDLAPYMENVMPGIKQSLVDPVPEVRAVAAKALGAMAKGMGDKCYDELLPWLMKTLVSEANSVDRSGAAQGLAEVIGSLGEDKLHRFMPEIIRKADSDDLAPHVRDGYTMMFIYMPSVFEKEFVQYIGQIINPILKALADENEFVRDTALRAGQRIVTGFAETAIALLLPELEKGIFDDNWRIRFSSIQLLGDLLYKISGVSGKMSTESAGDDDNFGTEQSQLTIIAALGLERRNRVLAGLYMGRSDVALMVRQAALHVWKVVVANTPKTLREILPTLFSLLLGCLASHSHDKRQVAARTLGDLVRKLGEKILPEIIPILEAGLDSTRSDEREGVCIGLSEIMASTSKEMILAFVDNLVPALRKALCDSSPQVRKAAAQTFGSLHSTVGSRALDEVVPNLMKQLGDSQEGEYALDGLGQILAVKSKAVMPFLIPQLTAPPVNTKALSILASVAGDSLSKHLGKILPAVLGVLSETAGTEQEKQELEYCERMILTIVDEIGVRMLIDELLSHTKAENPELRKSAVKLLAIFCIHTKADLEPYIAQLIRGLIQLMTENDPEMLLLVADAVTAVVKILDSAKKMAYVADVRQAIRFVHSDVGPDGTLPGLCTPKGINPLLPIFREALLNGGADLKEQAALGMGEVIALSTESSLKPSVAHVTGPLIRILGDRYGPHVKIAVLDALTLLMVKVGIHLKAFLPQLKTSFMKSTSDSNRVVRLKAEAALAQLTQFQPNATPIQASSSQEVK